MPPWEPCAGNTLLIPSGTSGKHLFLILNNPAKFDGYGSSVCVVLVNLSSIKNGLPGDDACICKAGEHRFISKDSFIDYRFARVERVNDLIAKVESRVFQAHESVSSDLLDRAISGLHKSKFTKREFKSLLLSASQ